GGKSFFILGFSFFLFLNCAGAFVGVPTRWRLFVRRRWISCQPTHRLRPSSCFSLNLALCRLRRTHVGKASADLLSGAEKLADRLGRPVPRLQFSALGGERVHQTSRPRIGGCRVPAHSLQRFKRLIGFLGKHTED